MSRQLVAYVSHDPLNSSDTEALLAARGARMDLIWLRDPPPNGAYAAILYDLDFLPATDREGILKELTAGPLTGRRGVHWHGLEEEQIAALEARGVVASRTLNGDLIGRLLGEPQGDWGLLSAGRGE
jgi:hypothetical protein